MDVFKWTDEQRSMAQKAIVERFARNSIAGHFVPEQTIGPTETTVRSNRYDFSRTIVIDVEQLGLYEPYARIRLTRAQSDEQDLARAMTTINRLASALARWHDTLVFTGHDEGKPPGVEMPALKHARTPKSFRESARDAETETNRAPVRVLGPNLNENLVAACYKAVLRLEGDGYYSAYHLVLGEKLWEELHRPTSGSLVLPRKRIEPTLMGGDFHRTTTLPANEALLISLDGPTLDCVVARVDPEKYPLFEPLRAEDIAEEEIYLFRVRERFAPRVRENRAIVRLKIPLEELEKLVKSYEFDKEELEKLNERETKEKAEELEKVEQRETKEKAKKEGA